MLPIEEDKKDKIMPTYICMLFIEDNYIITIHHTMMYQIEHIFEEL